MSSKLCAMCHTVRPLRFFFKDSARKDGLQSRCKDCHKTFKISPETRLLKRQSQLRQDAAHPEKPKARSIVANAVKRGRLIRQPCEVCGDQKSQAHHEDYSKPLEVRWLCDPHHKAHHKAMKAIEAALAKKIPKIFK